MFRQTKYKYTRHMTHDTGYNLRPQIPSTSSGNRIRELGYNDPVGDVDPQVMLLLEMTGANCIGIVIVRALMVFLWIQRVVKIS